LSNAFLYVLFGTAGAVVGGAAGTCWGVAVAATMGAVIWWVQLRRAIVDHLAVTVEPIVSGGDQA